MDKVTLIITEPTRSPNPSSKLSEDWHKFAEDQEYKNRVLFLTGSHETMERIVEQARQRREFTTDIASETFRKKCQARLFAGQKTSSWNEVKRRAATQPD